MLDPSPGGLAERIGNRLRAHRPVIAGGLVVLVGVLLMTTLLVGLGLLITHALVGGPVEAWDHHLNLWFVDQRTAALNPVANIGSELGATYTIIGVAARAIGTGSR